MKILSKCIIMDTQACVGEGTRLPLLLVNLFASSQILELEQKAPALGMKIFVDNFETHLQQLVGVVAAPKI